MLRLICLCSQRLLVNAFRPKKLNLYNLLRRSFLHYCLCFGRRNCLFASYLKKYFACLKSKIWSLNRLQPFSRCLLVTSILTFDGFLPRKTKVNVRFFEKIASLTFGKCESLSNKNIQLNGFSFQCKNKQTELI